MSLPARELSTEEQEQLPFEFINGTWQTQGNNLPDLVAATWNNNTVWARKPTGPWYFDQEGDPEVVPEDWAKYYPHLEQVTVTTINNTVLSGTYQGKRIRWHRNKRRWEYHNHFPVSFDPPEPSPEDPDVTEVSALLDAATTSASRTLATLTPERPEQRLPGDLPETPRKPEPVPAQQPPPAPVKQTKGKTKYSPSIPPPAPATPPPVTNPPMASSSTTGTGTATSTKTIGSPPEPFDGSSTKAEAFWTSLASYFFLNQEIYNTANKKIASALSYFKIGTSAGEWAKDRQITALALSTPDFGTWETFRDDFKSHFIPVDATLLSTQQMHSMKMGNRPFSDWYQEWSTHATRSGSNDATKMYAFRQNLPNALHTKILGVHPPPTTLARLVELAKGFDELYRLYNKSDSSKPQRRPNVRTTTPEDPDAPNIALADFPPKDRKFKKLTPEERDRRRRLGLCSYCGKSGHWHDKCPVKPQRRNTGPRPNPPRTRATEVEDETTTQTTPEPLPTVSHLYTIPEHHFDTSFQDPDHDINQDF